MSQDTKAVPPAGREVEVIGYFYQGDHMGDQFSKLCLKHYYRRPGAAEHEYIQPVELVDGVHVTRLQDELVQERKVRESAEGGWREANRVIAMQRAKLDEQEAERDALKAEVQTLRSAVDRQAKSALETLRENEVLQSELTKARELLDDCIGPVKDAENNAHNAADERLYHNLGNDIRAALAHQSAPAAKDGE